MVRCRTGFFSIIFPGSTWGPGVKRGDENADADADADAGADADADNDADADACAGADVCDAGGDVVGIIFTSFVLCSCNSYCP